MDDPDSVVQFHAGGAAHPGMLSVYDFSARALNALLPEGSRLLDLGVGSGRALVHLTRRRPDLTATAVDLAPNMLATARGLLDAEGLSTRVELVEADITALPERVAEGTWDGVSCIWTLHQLPDLVTLRGALRQIAQVRERTGAAIWILDFRRLRKRETFPAVLEVMDQSTNPVLREDAIASEAAGFTHEEMSTELAAAGLGDLRAGHARPIEWLQAFWAPRADLASSAGARWRSERLPRGARLDAFLLRSAFTAKPY